jgi:4-amino-4-deoxy-L-arabinose transferase-like glycosyltransferase
MTPWLSLLSIAGVIVALRARRMRGYALVLLAYAALPLVTMLAAKAKFVRYSYPLWPVGAVFVGLLVHQIAIRCRERGAEASRAFDVAAVGAMVGLVVFAFLVVPYGGVYTNPILGGAAVAEEVMLIGRDHEADAMYFIRDREGASCGQRRILSTSFRPWTPCGVIVGSRSELRPGDYIVLAGQERQRHPGEARSLRPYGRHVADIEVRGVDVAEILQVR